MVHNRQDKSLTDIAAYEPTPDLIPILWFDQGHVYACLKDYVPTVIVAPKLSPRLTLFLDFWFSKELTV